MEPTWLDNLKTLDAESLPTLYADETAAARRTAKGLDAHPRWLLQKAEKRKLIDARKTVGAAAALPRLPGVGESLHLIISETVDLCDLMPRVIDLAACRCERLTLATLGFHERTLDKLMAEADKGNLLSVRLLASCYFRSTEKDLWSRSVADFTARGWQIAAARSHAKIQLYTFEDGCRITFESSANLRTCHNAEQVTIYADPALHGFHQQWIGELYEKAIQCEAASQR